MTGETYDTEETEYTYDEILDKKFQMILPTDYYRYNAEKDIWEDMREDETYMKNVVDNGTQIQVCGIIRQKEDAVNTAIRSGVGYTKELMQYLMQGVNDSEVAKVSLPMKQPIFLRESRLTMTRIHRLQWMMSMHMLQRFQSRNRHRCRLT